jgi:hypothetical protein
MPIAAGAHPRVKFAILRGLKHPEQFNEGLSNLLAGSSSFSHRFSDKPKAVAQVAPDSG